jgi:hypothetical protein
MPRKFLTFLILACAAGLALQARAGESILPDIPQAQARFSATQGCMRPTEDMRKNHMKYLLHKRDLTMHEGIRTTQFSLKQCIDCHVSAAPDAARFPSKKHFCNSCHTYAAVEIDCFQCHADRPLKDAQGKFVISGDDTLPRSGTGLEATGNIHVLATEDDAHE